MSTERELPAIIKKNVRSVLLSKIGGVLVSDFLKDYKSLIGKPLSYRDLGFTTLKDLIDALTKAEVARLEYSEAQMAHKMFGIGEPSMYMSLSAKRAQGTLNMPQKKTTTSSANGDVDDSDFENLIPNARGVYSLCYPRHCEPKSVTEDESSDYTKDKLYESENVTNLLSTTHGTYSKISPNAFKREVMEKFSAFGDVADINMIPGLIFVRFDDKEAAMAALTRYKDELDLRVAEEKKTANKNPKKNLPIKKNADTELVQKREKQPAPNKNKMEVYVGNISQNITEGEFRELINEFSPMDFRMVRAKSDPRKVCAFVDFPLNCTNEADTFIQKLHQKEVKGRKLNVRYAVPEGAPKDRNGRAQPVREGKSDTLVGGSDIRQGNVCRRPQEQKQLEEDEDAWDDNTEEKTPPKSSASDLTNKMSALTVDTSQIPQHSPNSCPGSYPYTKGSPQQSPHIYTNSSYSPQAPSHRSPMASQLQRSTVVDTQSNGYASPSEAMKHSARSPQVKGYSLDIEGVPKLEPVDSRNYSARSPQVKGHSLDIEGIPKLEPIDARNYNARSPQVKGHSLDIEGIPKLEPIDHRNYNARSLQVKGHALDIEDIPKLEPVMPNLEYIERPVILFVGNFVYGATEEDLARLFAAYKVVDVNIQNTYDKRKSTQALVTVGSLELAEKAMAELNQHYVNSRRMLVCIAKQDPLYEVPAVFTKPRDAIDIKCTINAGGDAYRNVAMIPGEGSLKSSSSSSSIDTTGSGPIFKKTFNSLLRTFQIILTKLGVRRRDTAYRSGDSLTVFITSIFDETCFWGQVIQNETNLSSLEEIMTGLQHPDSRVGPTKGLGRCAALHENDWFRGWITAERNRYHVDVFYVDYGNTATIQKQATSLTVPEVWEVSPMVRPFRLAEGLSVPLTKEMESKIAILKVVKSSVDETGYLTEVTITSMPQ